jgi:hypothetical protein
MTIEIGAIVNGFRIEDVLGNGSTGVVYEATQLVLDRRVALKLLDKRWASDPVFDERFRKATREQSALHHPHIVAVYDVGASAHGPYIAMQLVRGTTLAALLSARSIEATRALALLAQTAEALDAAHAAGVVHGDIRSQNILIDQSERAFLTDFGLSTASSAGYGTPGREALLASEEHTPEADRDAFARVVLECLADQPSAAKDRIRGAFRNGGAATMVSAAAALIGKPRRSRRRRRLYAGAAFLAVSAVPAVLIFRSATTTPAAQRQPAPSVAAGAIALGSALSPGGFRSVGCDGRSPGPSAPACTVLQTTLSQRVLAAPGDGVIHKWAVRGARGRMRVQVVRRIHGPCLGGGTTSAEARVADRCFARVFTSQLVEVPDERVHVFPVDLEVERGDLVGLALSPGAAIGVRPGRAATTARWIGPLQIEPRTPTEGKGTSLDQEILLRADFVEGVRRSLPARLNGSAAARAPFGTEVDGQTRELSDGRVARVSVVTLSDSVALDMVIGTTRSCRIEIPDADPAGRLSINQVVQTGDAARSGGIPVADIRIVWSNPGSALPVEHRYALTPDGIEFID